MSDFNDLPLIQCRPAPGDAELQAQRDAQHRSDVARWLIEEWDEPYADPFRTRLVRG